MSSTSIIYLQNAEISIHDMAVLRNVNFSLEMGSFAYLIGKTGSGKTTFLKTLYADRPLKVGTGIVADFDLTKMHYKNVHLLRRKIGMVFQDFNLLSDRNVEENLKFVLKATGWKDKFLIDSRIDEVLDQVGMANTGHKMPHELSGGEQQKIVIARALINYPVLILADEPTGNLDPETSFEILNLLMSTSQKNNVAILMATHDHRLIASHPARIMECKHGQLLDTHHLPNLAKSI